MENFKIYVSLFQPQFTRSLAINGFHTISLYFQILLDLIMYLFIFSRDFPNHLALIQVWAYPKISLFYCLNALEVCDRLLNNLWLCIPFLPSELQAQFTTERLEALEIHILKDMIKQLDLLTFLPICNRIGQ